MWWSAQTWTTPLNPFAPHALSHRLWLTASGLVEKDLPCEIMTITAGVRGLTGVLCVVSLVFFFLLTLYHIAILIYCFIESLPPTIVLLFSRLALKSEDPIGIKQSNR